MGRQGPRSVARPIRAALVGLGVAALIGACGLEGQQGAIGPDTAPADQASLADVEPVRPGVVSVDPDWQELQLGPHLSAWLPTSAGWQLTGQGTNARGGSYVAMSGPDARMGVRAETWPSGDQSAAELCAVTLAALLGDAGITDVRPQPSGNPAPGSQLVDAFSCHAVSVPTASGPKDYLLDVLVRQSDQITYTQLAVVPTQTADPDARTGFLDLAAEMLARTLSGLEQR